MPYVVTGFDGTERVFNALEDAYRHVVACIERPDLWHRMLLHHVQDLFQSHRVPNTRLIVQVAFTDSKLEWYEIQVARGLQLHSPHSSSAALTL